MEGGRAMTELGRMSKQDLNRLPELDPVEAGRKLRQALGFAPARCMECGASNVARRRIGTSFAGCCNACGGTLELLDRS
jgi:hypothetical protein